MRKGTIDSLYIESPQNPRIKHYKQLKNKKGRDTSHLFLAEGIRLVEEAIQSDFELEALLWNVGTDELPETISRHDKCRNALCELSPGAFAEVSDTVTSQGVIAVVRMKDQGPDIAQSDLAVLLDGVQDPGNVGTLIRSCDAFGFAGVCCGTNTADPFSPKVLRATMGGLFRVRVSTQPSSDFVAEWRELHPEGYIVVSDANVDDVCYQVNLKGPCLIVVGSEAFGVSEPVRNLATHRVAIPMVGGAESLNAGIAGSVFMYESARQRLNG
jgi:RNA methyltransferase, TrmH family